MSKGTIQPSNRNDRFNALIEGRDNRDFPFYNGKPIELNTWQWSVIWLSTAIGMAVLMLTPQPNNLFALLPRFLFLAIPLATFAYFTRGAWRSLFYRPKLADYGLMIGFFVLNLAVSGVVAIAVSSLFGANANQATNGLEHADALEITAFYVGTAIQLMGEEIFTMLPFLALMYFFYSKGKLSRTSAIIGAWVLSAVWFGAAHLPTYGWNIMQALLIIGSARIILTLAYIRTKNLWVSYGAHVLNDWAIFTIILITAIASGK